MMTFQPSLEIKPQTIAYPIPLLEPVTMTFLRFCIRKNYKQQRYLYFKIVMKNMEEQNTPIKKSISKNIVVTGGCTGIGLQLIKQLYREGNNIVFGSNDQSGNSQALKYFQTIQGGIISAYYFDLASKKSIEDFSNKVHKHFFSVDILVNNAGVYMSSGKIINENGIELTLAVNYFGHFYLTYLLMPLLIKSESARIISTASIMHYFAFSSFLDDLSCQKGFFDLKQYTISKFMIVVFTQGLTKYFQENKINNIKAVCLHPGFVATHLTQEAHKRKFYLRVFKKMTNCLYVNAEVGAKTSLFLCRLQFQRLQDGEYYVNKRVSYMNRRARDPKVIKRLWEVSQTIFDIKFG